MTSVSDENHMKNHMKNRLEKINILTLQIYNVKNNNNLRQLCLLGKRLHK